MKSVLLSSALLPCLVLAQEVVRCGGGSYASYAPWRLARSTRHRGDQSRFMQNRPVYLAPEMARRVAEGEPIPTNDWWTDALVSRWTGNLWSYPAKVRVGADGVRVAFPSYWIDDGTEMKERTALVFGAKGAFAPDAARVAGWHDWDVELELRDGEKFIRTTLVHGSPFTWIEYGGIEPKIASEGGEMSSGGGLERIVSVGDDLYGVWEDGRSFAVIGLLPDRSSFAELSKYACAVIRSTRVDWKYDESTAMVTTTWNVETEDLRGKEKSPAALQGFQPHHLKRTKPRFRCVEGLEWRTPRGLQRAASGNSLSIDYAFPGMLPYWAPLGGAREKGVFGELLADYAERGNFGGDTYWGGKGLLQMAFAMMGARENGDEETFRAAHAKLRAKFEDWLTWNPGEERFFFSYVPKWGGLVGEGTSYDSDAFNDHHFHYGYFTYSGALLCMADPDFAAKFGPMLRLVAADYANWDRSDRRFPLFRTFDPWAGHSFAGGVGDGNGNGQESSSEAMQGWGGLYLLGLALGDDAMRDAGLFGYVSEARGTAEYWFDRDKENIDYTKYTKPYNSNLTCHGVGWWTYFSGDPVWMHSIQWLPNTPALDYLSEDLEFAKWDWETMWKSKEIGGWFEKGRTKNGRETPPVGNESLGNVLLSYLQRHNPREAAEVFDSLREREMGAGVNADTAHMTYWATHSHLAYGELDFSVRADYPCARAFVKDGARILMAYNCGSAPRRVRFFDAAGRTVGEIEAVPGRLTVGGRPGAPVPRLAYAAPAKPADGLEIESERAVLKEGEPTVLKAVVRVGGRTREVKAEWSGEGGSFGPGGAFTPHGAPFAAVTAKAGGLSASKRIPVEEALAVSTLSFASKNLVAIVGDGVRLGLSATDQFEGRMPLKGIQLTVSGPNGAKSPPDSYKLRKGGVFVPLKPGKYVLSAALGGVSATCSVTAGELKDVNLARLAAVTASGEENGGLLARFAADGDMKTRWSSRHRDGEWIAFDFGCERMVSSCTIEWEHARAEEYSIEVSTDGVAWKRVADVAGNGGGRREHRFAPVKARALRITGRKRSTPYGISIFETEIR